MKAKELMVGDVRACRPEDDLNEAARIMWEADCGVVPVADERGSLVGVVTDRDVCMACYTKGLSPCAVTVEDVMSRDVVTCRPDDSLESVMSSMRKARVRRIPVTDASGALIGILSLNDLAREAMRQMEAGGRAQLSRVLVETLGAVCEPRGGLGSPAARARMGRVLVGSGA